MQRAFLSLFGQTRNKTTTFISAAGTCEHSPSSCNYPFSHNFLKMNASAPPLTLAHGSLTEAQAILKAHATSQGYVVATKSTKRVSRRKEGDVKVVHNQCSQSNAPVVCSGQRERMKPIRSSCKTKRVFITLRELCPDVKA